MLFDAGNVVAASFGLKFAVPAAVRDIYMNVFGLDLEADNGDPSWTLPMPGAIIVAPDGVVAYRSVDPDYTVRPEPDEVLANLLSLTG